jgi:hypothetical protein
MYKITGERHTFSKNKHLIYDNVLSHREQGLGYLTDVAQKRLHFAKPRPECARCFVGSVSNI